MADQIVFSSEPTGPDAPEGTSNESNQQQQQDQNQQQPQQEGERPDWLPENFKSVEDFRKSYDEQRSQLTKLQQEAAEAKKAAESKEKDAGSDDNAGKDGEGDDKGNANTPDISKLTEEDVADFSKELAETGEISEESRTKLKEMVNAPDWMLDTYIAGVKAQNEAIASTVSNAFGGNEAQQEIMNWAGQNLSDSEMETLNKQFDSGDMGTILFAIDAVKGKYEAANGKVPSRKIDGRPNSATSTYTSWDQVSADMNDPKYHSDPAFRAQVKEKLRHFNG